MAAGISDPQEYEAHTPEKVLPREEIHTTHHQTTTLTKSKFE